jgi:hypothetical protein
VGISGRTINHMQIPDGRWEIYYSILGGNPDFEVWLEAFAVKVVGCCERGCVCGNECSQWEAGMDLST